MPRYAFIDENSVRHEFIFTIAELNERRLVGGKFRLPNGGKGKMDFSAHAGISTCPSNYPMACEAMAVNPEDVSRQKAEDRKRGVRETDYTKDGSPIFNDKLHRREYCESQGFFDRNGGYGDPQRGCRN
jgi:hypothetical protein